MGLFPWCLFASEGKPDTLTGKRETRAYGTICGQSRVAFGKTAGGMVWLINLMKGNAFADVSSGLNNNQSRLGQSKMEAKVWFGALLVPTLPVGNPCGRSAIAERSSGWQHLGN